MVTNSIVGAWKSQGHGADHGNTTLHKLTRDQVSRKYYNTIHLHQTPSNRVVWMYCSGSSRYCSCRSHTNHTVIPRALVGKPLHCVILLHFSVIKSWAKYLFFPNETISLLQVNNYMSKYILLPVFTEQNF